MYLQAFIMFYQQNFNFDLLWDCKESGNKPDSKSNSQIIQYCKSGTKTILFTKHDNFLGTNP